MTVKELIAKLSKLPQDAVVKFDHPDGYGLQSHCLIQSGYAQGPSFSPKKKKLKKPTRWDVMDWYDEKYGHLEIQPPVPETVDLPVERTVVIHIDERR